MRELPLQTFRRNALALSKDGAFKGSARVHSMSSLANSCRLGGCMVVRGRKRFDHTLAPWNVTTAGATSLGASSSLSTASSLPSFEKEELKDSDTHSNNVDYKADVAVHVTQSSSSSNDGVVANAKIMSDATVLVDNLLDRTHSLMAGYQNHLIAFSGGVDSSLVAKLVHTCSTHHNLRPHEQHPNKALNGTQLVEYPKNDSVVRAILGISPAVPTDQIELAEQVATHIGISLEQIYTTEGTDATYIENSGQACFACKTHLYSCMTAIAEHVLADSNHDGDDTTTDNNSLERSPLRLYNGTNADDLKDPTRLGLIAADQFDVQSPLRYTTKDEVRMAAKHLGLPNWTYAASPCLRSRLALGVPALPEELHRIEQGERHVRQSLQLQVTDNLRVRLLAKNRAMIEVDELHLDVAQSYLSEDVQLWQTYFQDELGFSSVGVRAFRTGSVATNAKK